MRPNSQRGQVYPLFGIMLTVLIGISSLSVDLGYYRYQQRVQQAATDSAAIAGAQMSFYDSANANNYKLAAQADASKNGFTDGSGGVTVNVTPYTDGGNCSDGCTRVEIDKQYPIFFGSIFKGFGKNGDKKTIATYAASKLAAVSGSCLTSLGTNPTSSTSNGAKIDGPDCGIANKDCTTVNGGTNVNVATWAVNAACGASNTWSGGTSQFVPSLPPTDPCSVFTECQTLAGASVSDLGITGTKASPTGCTVASNRTVGSAFSGTLSPGCYNAQTWGKSGSTITLNPGLYVMVGKNTFNGTITGNGVTFYFTTGATYDDKSNATINLTASTTGDFTGAPTFGLSVGGEKGVLMYQAPASKWSSTIQANIAWTGLVYMPNWDVTFNGHSEAITGNFTCDSFTVNGGSSLTLNPGSGSTQGSPSQAILAE